jgi:hypothetical protein
MTADKIKALRAVRDGGQVARHEVNWLQHWGMIDKNKKLTVKGGQALADYDEENTGD